MCHRRGICPRALDESIGDPKQSKDLGSGTKALASSPTSCHSKYLTTLDRPIQTPHTQEFKLPSNGIKMRYDALVTLLALIAGVTAQNDQSASSASSMASSQSSAASSASASQSAASSISSVVASISSSAQSAIVSASSSAASLGPSAISSAVSSVQSGVSSAIASATSTSGAEPTGFADGPLAVGAVIVAGFAQYILY